MSARAPAVSERLLARACQRLGIEGCVHIVELAKTLHEALATAYTDALDAVERCNCHGTSLAGRRWDRALSACALLAHCCTSMDAAASLRSVHLRYILRVCLRAVAQTEAMQATVDAVTSPERFPGAARDDGWTAASVRDTVERVAATSAALGNAAAALSDAVLRRTMYEARAAVTQRRAAARLWARARELRRAAAAPPAVEVEEDDIDGGDDGG